MRRRSTTVTLASAVLGGSLLVVAADARAGAAWGDASLARADVRIELSPDGRAQITHTVGLRVSGKKFRAFAIDGVDDGLEPPDDQATLAGRDGPGWPATATDGKGGSVEAFVEPAKEPRKLRVRLGLDGVPRGDYVVQVRYRVDLARANAFVRDGALTRFSWTAPRWPEGYDGGKIVIALPAAPTEPKLAIADVGGDGEHPADGVALLSLKRGSLADELEITRPHVPPHDDTRWILRVDPKALPSVAASVAALEHEHREAGVAPAPHGRRARTTLGVLAGALGVALGIALARRDRDAQLAGAFRPLLRLSPTARSIGYGVTSALAIAAAWTSFPLLGAACVLAAMALATQRAPFPAAEPRAVGRWLAVPDAAIAPGSRAPLGPFDPRGRTAKIALGAIAVAFGAAIALLSRRDPRAAVALAIDATLLLPLFLSGRSAQLPPDRVAGAWDRLLPIAEGLRQAEPSRVRAIARTAGRAIDEVRVRVEPRQRGASWLLEIGCGLVHGPGGARLCPEILVRTDASSGLAEHLERLTRGAPALRGEDEIALALGRSPDERVLCVRPAEARPAAIVARATALIEAAEAFASAAPAGAPRDSDVTSSEQTAAAA
ncbi:MAG: hypothetical protein HYV09_14560 [Deltaproteobacteria bacterium]|nr:hypothetical protein [Deltaproteobacteria bacterium]